MPKSRRGSQAATDGAGKTGIDSFIVGLQLSPIKPLFTGKFRAQFNLLGRYCFIRRPIGR